MGTNNLSVVIIPIYEFVWTVDRVLFPSGPNARIKECSLAVVARKLEGSLSMMPMLLCLVAICATGCQSFSPFGRSAESISMSRQLTSSGLSALENGRHLQAEELLTQAAEKNPADSRIRSHLASALVKQGKMSEAIEQLETASKHSSDVDLHVELGNLYLEQGRWLQANQQADIAIRSNSKSTSALVLKGDIESAKKEFSSALGLYQRALGFDPGLPDVQLRVAQTYQKLGQPMRALATAEQILSSFPQDQLPNVALVAKGIALMETQQFSSAIDVLKLASASNEADIDTFVRLGQAQLSAGQVSEARLTLNRARQRFPDNPQVGQLVADLKTASSNVASIGN